METIYSELNKELSNNTDKFLHNYTSKYNDLFLDRKDEKLNIFEVGIGSIPMPSLRLWKKYFKNSHIYGIDVEPSFIDNSIKDITTLVCNSLIKKDVEEKIKPLGMFDIIIDDGCHRCDGQQITFSNLFKYLSPKGIYVIEDCGASFNHGYNINSKDMNLLSKEYTIGPPDGRIKVDIPDFLYDNVMLNKIFTTYNVFMNFNPTKKIQSFYIENNITQEEILSIENRIDKVEYWQGEKNTDSLIIIYSK
tara:strand:- start:5767 stop:6513 length:747 start_codon:yes stop_codon:yes gene_type:complete